MRFREADLTPHEILALAAKAKKTGNREAFEIEEKHTKEMTKRLCRTLGIDVDLHKTAPFSWILFDIDEVCSQDVS